MFTDLLAQKRPRQKWQTLLECQVQQTQQANSSHWLCLDKAAQAQFNTKSSSLTTLFCLLIMWLHAFVKTYSAMHQKECIFPLYVNKYFSKIKKKMQQPDRSGKLGLSLGPTNTQWGKYFINILNLILLLWKKEKKKKEN